MVLVLWWAACRTSEHCGQDWSSVWWSEPRCSVQLQVWGIGDGGVLDDGGVCAEFGGWPLWDGLSLLEWPPSRGWCSSLPLGLTTEDMKS